MQIQELSLFDTPLPSHSEPKKSAEKHTCVKVNDKVHRKLEYVVLTDEEEKLIASVRRSLGDTCENLSNIQIKNILTNFQTLCDSWLDEFERQTFEGSTLKELLGNK